MKSTKRYISFFLTIVIVFSVSVSAMPASANITHADASDTFKLSAISYPENLESLAIQYLADVIPVALQAPEMFGFTSRELLDLQLGKPFSIYIFDDRFQLVSMDNWVFPILYNGDIVGVVESSYNNRNEEYNFTFGKAYGDELNTVKNNYIGSDEKLFIGRYDDMLFSSNGREANVFFNRSSLRLTAVDVDQLLLSIPLYDTITNSKFEDVLESISGNIAPNAPVTRYQFTLPVPHVLQSSGQNCGIAAWAAVLNYRFSSTYTTATLTTAFVNQGYIPNATSTPSMQSYPDYANSNYTNANAVYISGAPSPTTVMNLLSDYRPIMGSWESPNPAGGGKVYHGVIIVGYFSAGGIMIYTVKNPWYAYTQVTSPLSQGGVYSDAGYTWTLYAYTY
ncbi:MAG: hypothetical protein FWH17_08755 [Oscillospiraceae bacterium]|nr:hypothetical protein [Oscillospiraceae bacterium]